MLSKLNDERRADETRIMENLLSCIDEKKSLIFNAGAGAGKTYALVECLKYLCKTKEDILKYHNQKAVCITYTNVAANEVKDRIGNTDLILISSIHERLWEFIKDYQDELVSIHLNNLKNQIVEIQQKIDEDAVWRILTKEQREEFVQILFERRKDFYELPKAAKAFRTKFQEVFPEFVATIGKVDTFRSACSRIVKLKKYEKCITAIENAEKEHVEIQYDARNNRDRLEYMKISHDTLLLYANQIIDKYDDLKRFIVDKYPYFFIDEYQDTSELVVQMISKLEEYSKKINHPIFVGYFGDYVQNIYEKGIGEKIREYCAAYEQIDKKYNRRSCEEIINLANNIRNDGLKQQSIYSDSTGGSVEVFYGKDDDISEFIRVNSSELKSISVGDKHIHCFLLLNKVVAEYAGVGQLHNWFNSTPFYKKHFDALTTELLNNDTDKLGEIERYLYNIIEFVSKSQEDETPLLDILPKELLHSLDIKSVGEIVKVLPKVKTASLKDILLGVESFKHNLMCKLANKKNIEQAIESITGMDDFSLNHFANKVKESLFEDGEGSEKQVVELLEMDSNIFFQWYRYIRRNYEEDIAYHTFHGTKGLEFDNVILIFGDSFGKQSNYFKEFFNERGAEMQDEKYKRARNLLYVAVTRARINLRIFYTGDYSLNKDAIKDIFGEVTEWKSCKTNEITI